MVLVITFVIAVYLVYSQAVEDWSKRCCSRIHFDTVIMNIDQSVIVQGTVNSKNNVKHTRRNNKTPYIDSKLRKCLIENKTIGSFMINH